MITYIQLLLFPCREWTGATDRRGYGRTPDPKKDGIALNHRRTWTQQVGPISRGLHVLHCCDNPPCHEITHLWLGTHQDNMADRDRKGRCNAGQKQHGEQNHQAVLTNDQVRDIRRRGIKGNRWTGSGNYKDLALEYGVKLALIQAVMSRRSYGGVV